MAALEARGAVLTAEIVTGDQCSIVTTTGFVRCSVVVVVAGFVAGTMRVRMIVTRMIVTRVVVTRVVVRVRVIVARVIVTRVIVIVIAIGAVLVRVHVRFRGGFVRLFDLGHVELCSLAE